MEGREAVAADASPDIAFDAGRAFLGPHASFYDEQWRLMAWRGRRRSWNSAAALAGPFWFAYRVMPGLALGAGLAWLVPVGLVVRGMPVAAAMVLAALLMTVQGLYANALYLARFRKLGRRIDRAAADPMEREARYRHAGGVNPRLVVVAIVLFALATGAMVAGKLV